MSEHQNSDFFVWYIIEMKNHMTLQLQNYLSFCSAHKANRSKILFSFVQLDKNYDEWSWSWMKLLHSIHCLKLKKKKIPHIGGWIHLFLCGLQKGKRTAHSCCSFTKSQSLSLDLTQYCFIMNVYYTNRRHYNTLIKACNTITHVNGTSYTEFLQQNFLFNTHLYPKSTQLLIK